MQQKRYHLIIDLSQVPDVLLTDQTGLTKILKLLPSAIDMHILHGPEVVKGIEQNPGLSGFVIIDYSHISIHTFSEYGEALVDIFSCKPFNQQVVIEEVLKYFRVSVNQARIKEVFWG